LEDIMLYEKPDWVLIYGDTNSTLAAALAAAKLHISIAHVEAGLRSFNRRMPEEINRVVADHLSGLLFAPTDLALRQLATEGITSGVHMVGDVMYDIAKTAMQNLPALPSGLKKRSFALATIHRAENTDDRGRLRAIFEGLAMFAKEVQVVLPLHPRTRKALSASGMLEDVSRQLTVLEPLGYADMLALEAAARLVITDSGGVQKEAYFQRVPCVTLRDETEWVELVETGWNRLCPPENAQAVTAACRAALDTAGEAVDLYGGGNASGTIAALLAERGGISV
jgi:UDP-GlcNAc3NAcA epimerase